MKKSQLIKLIREEIINEFDPYHNIDDETLGLTNLKQRSPEEVDEMINKLRELRRWLLISTSDSFDKISVRSLKLNSEILSREINSIEKDIQPLQEANFKVGSPLTVPKFLTTDPLNKQGETGRVLKFTDNGETTHLKFKDGKVGKYNTDIWTN